MTRFVWAPCALVLVLVLGFAGCTQSKSATENPVQTAQAATLTKSDMMVAEVERDFASFKGYRDTSVGWAAEVRPGDRRSTNEVGNDLAKLSSMEALIVDAPNSDKVGSLRGEIRSLMIEDSKLLLRKARSEQNIWALGQFVRFAKDLDVDLETDFGVKPADLRKEALVMAQKEVAELRPRIRDGSGDAIGALMTLNNEWQFTREELGLTADEARLLTER
ncbi:MAG: hypothetical protein AAB695_02145 [Patescibacteria group bacterium]